MSSAYRALQHLFEKSRNVIFCLLDEKSPNPPQKVILEPPVLARSVLCWPEKSMCWPECVRSRSERPSVGSIESCVDTEMAFRSRVHRRTRCGLHTEGQEWRQLKRILQHHLRCSRWMNTSYFFRRWLSAEGAKQESINR